MSAALATWPPLQDELSAPYMRELSAFLRAERERGVRVYPRPSRFFAAFEATPLEDVKVLVIGQDPYHGERQAMGLAFSVPDGTAPPPSLRNIFKELHDDIGIPTPASGDLTPWAGQGVLLLNSVLSVRAGAARSHAGRGWEEFTDTAIRVCSEHSPGMVCMLWGRDARAKRPLIDARKHHILEAPHPSPLSAHTGFFGCRHFSRANGWLAERGMTPVEWSLPAVTA